MRNRTSDIVLGLLFFGTLIGLFWITAVLQDFRWLREETTVEIVSDDVGYLRVGDPVLLHGMPAGKVVAIERMADPVVATLPDTDKQIPCTIRITAQMDTDPWPLLSSNHRVLIEDRGLLGGKLVRIEAGDSPRPADRGQPLVALATTSAWQSLATVIDENRDSVRAAIDNFSATFDAAANGDGLVASLLHDPKVKDDVGAASDNFRTVSENLKTASADAAEIAREAREGRGTLARFVYDDDIYNDTKALLDSADEITADLRSVSARLEEGRGTLGRLLGEDDALYRKLEKIADDIDGFTGKLDTGEGILGALNDEQLADDLREIIAQLKGAIEDARETTPVQEVGSFLFGTF